MNLLSAGNIILFGSGESSPIGAEILRKFFSSKEELQTISIVETPAGFQPNSDQVATDIADFYYASLKEFINQITVIPARAKHTHFSPDNEDILQPLIESNFIFLGPGSPTYAVRQLRQSIAFKKMVDQWQKGTTLAFSSAAAIAMGTYTLPVYEIYKAGHDLYWVEGLEFFHNIGIDISVIAHWNNTDGGEKHDTSRCYMGQTRFERLRKLITPNAPILGIDENTALIIDVITNSCTVLGRGSVTLLKNNEIFILEKNVYYSLNLLRKGINGVGTAFLTSKKIVQERKSTEEIPKEIQELVEKRQKARVNKDYKLADTIREELFNKGYQIEDTPSGLKVYQSS